MFIAVFRAAAVAGLVLSCVVVAPAAEVPLTKPTGLSSDRPGEATGSPKGFVAAWSRVRADTGEGSVSLRQFAPNGRALGKDLVLDAGPTGFFDPIGLSLGGDRAAGFWIRGADGLVGRAGALTTGKLDGEVVIGKLAEAYADVALLANGGFQAVTYQMDVSNPSAPVKRVAVTTLSPALKVVGGPTPLPGPGASFVATASSDFTIVARKRAGSVAVYRNRADGNVYAVAVSATGKPGAAKRVNLQPMPLGTGGQQTVFEVEAAMLKSGRIVVAWTGIGSDEEDDAFDIRYRLLTEAGVPIGPERVAHASLVEEQIFPEIVPLRTGRFVLSWTNNGGPVAGRPRSYVMRTFNATGRPTGAERTIVTGERAVNGEEAQLVPAGTGLMLIRTVGTLPATLAGVPAKP